MRRPANNETPLPELLFPGDPTPENLEEATRRLAELRADPAQGPTLDRRLAEALGLQHLGLLECRRQQEKFGELLEKMTAPPWFVAVFRRLEASPKGPRALVQQGGVCRVAALAQGLDAAAFQPGDEVFLSTEQNCILEKAPARPHAGETCVFDRRATGDRLIVKSREEELIVEAAAGLRGATLKPGDVLGFDRALLLAYERLDRPEHNQFLLEETPTETFAGIGGMRPQIARLQRTLRLHLDHPALAGRYQLRRKGSVLLHGPVGTGKTMLARAVANWLGGLSASGRSWFMNVKPGSLHSEWFSVSERHYREIFRHARELALAQPRGYVVLFFDEVDAIGGARGQSYMRVTDQVLTAFLTELDGLQSRAPNVLVMAATNRLEALDAALLRPGRLGDLRLEIPRPDRPAAADIFEKHLPLAIPYARNGHGDDAAGSRQEIIQATIARIYGPNAESELATITFRDGKRRPVRGADLISGAVIANVARNAAERAAERELETRASGLRLEDVTQALGEEFTTAARVLTPANCRHHLSGLPQDSDVVKVELVTRRVARPEKYLNTV